MMLGVKCMIGMIRTWDEERKISMYEVIAWSVHSHD